LPQNSKIATITAIAVESLYSQPALVNSCPNEIFLDRVIYMYLQSILYTFAKLARVPRHIWDNNIFRS
jgi:hypothetical protein